MNGIWTKSPARASDLVQMQRDQHRSKPVDRTPGADQESPVDKLPKLDHLQITSMHQPRKDAVKNKRR